MKRWRCCCKQSEGEFLASLRGETSHLKCILVAALEVLESRVFKVIQTVCRPGLTGCVCVCVGPVLLMSGEMELQPLCDMNLIGFSGRGLTPPEWKRKHEVR